MVSVSDRSAVLAQNAGMKALVQQRYGGAGDLVLQDLDLPKPAEGEVRVRVLACGANASDWEFVTARPAYARAYGMLRSGRRVLGSDVVGIVDVVGSGVTGFAPGQTVLGDIFGHFGGFAEFVVAPADLWVPVPGEIDPVEIAALPQSGTIALCALSDFVKPGQNVLINGAGGGSGVLAVQLALAGAARVTAVDNTSKAEMLLSLGVHRFVDYQKEDVSKRGECFDVILDLWGTRGVFAIRRMLAPSGRYHWIGGHVSVLLQLLTIGAVMSRISNRHTGLFVVPQGPARLLELVQLLQQGVLRPVVGRIATLSQAAEALEMMGKGQIAGKLVIRP